MSLHEALSKNTPKNGVFSYSFDIGCNDSDMGVEPKIGKHPKMDVKIRENPIEMMIWGENPLIFGNTYIYLTSSKSSHGTRSSPTSNFLKVGRLPDYTTSLKRLDVKSPQFTRKWMSSYHTVDGFRNPKANHRLDA